MKKIWIIGIGSGHPEHLTLQAARIMQTVDVFFLPDKGPHKQALHQLRELLCAQVISHRNYTTVDFTMPQRPAMPDDYRASTRQWHEQLQQLYAGLLATRLPEGQSGAFLVWGDPALYDGTIRVIAAIHAQMGGFDYDVIPGISSVQALAARFRQPLNHIGENILLTPGRKLPDDWPAMIDNMVVMLDGQHHLQRLQGQQLHICWGANLGTAGEVLIQGPLDACLDRIESSRRQLRASHGWVMDTSLLRRLHDDEA